MSQFEPTVEKTWESSGYQCEVRIMPLGHRCGYVGVRKGHPLYGVHYDNAPLFLHTLVNGGLTYSAQEGDIWVFGFDFHHGWNALDPDLLPYVTDSFKDTFVQLSKIEYPNSKIPTLGDAISDCEALASGLKQCSGIRFRVKRFIYFLAKQSSMR